MIADILCNLFGESFHGETSSLHPDTNLSSFQAYVSGVEVLK